MKWPGSDGLIKGLEQLCAEQLCHLAGVLKADRPDPTSGCPSSENSLPKNRQLDSKKRKQAGNSGDEGCGSGMRG